MACSTGKSSLFFLLFLLLNTACQQQLHHTALSGYKEQQKQPFWVEHPEKLSPFVAVGFSRPNFQGMHIQKREALLKAREILSQRISSYISSKYEKEIQSAAKAAHKRYSEELENISKLLLQNSSQKDAYIDERGNLYLLVALDSKNVKQDLPPLGGEPFSLEPLLQRRCYAPSVLKSLHTKSKIYKGKPLWFYRPDISLTKKGAVGIAERTQRATPSSQKETAYLYAKNELLQRVKMQIDSYDKLSKVVSHDALGAIEHWKLQTKSTGHINNAVIKDIWMDPQSCEMYVWVTEK